jgi:hypothetical protein
MHTPHLLRTGSLKAPPQCLLLAFNPRLAKRAARLFPDLVCAKSKPPLSENRDSDPEVQHTEAHA